MPKLCRSCGANLALLKEMLSEPPENGLETENHATARFIIGNCQECRESLKGRLEDGY